MQLVVQITFLDLSKGYFEKYLRNNNSKNPVHTCKLNYNRLKLCLSRPQSSTETECKKNKICHAMSHYYIRISRWW